MRNDSTMKTTNIETDIRKLLCGEISVVQQGIDRYAIHTPFTFGDGDSFVSILKKEGGVWVLTDEGHTFMHMSYENVDFLAGTRGRVLDEALHQHGLDNASGELRMRIPRADQIGHAVFSFVHAMSKVSNVTQFTKEMVRSTFMDDFRDFLETLAPNGPLVFNWNDPVKDPDALYPVDCRINTPRQPWHVFGVANSDKCKNVTITCLKIESIDPAARSIAIFENQAEVNSRAVAQMTDVVFKQFSSLGEKSRIKKYFSEQVFGSAM